jgi:hypothetical protein
MPKLNAWALWSRIAANNVRFEASAEVVETAALYVIRTQLARAENAAQLRAIGEVAGPDAIAAAINGLSPGEASRILVAFDPAAAELKAAHARAALAALILLNPAPEAAPPPQVRQMRRHKAIGARRIRSS